MNTAAAYKAIPDITPAVQAAAGLAYKKAYAHAFSVTYLVAIAFGVTAMVAAFFTEDIKKEKKNNSRAVRLENEKAKSEEDLAVEKV